MPLTLPNSIATFFDASNGGDIARLNLCFAPDAIVHDESHRHVGHQAIQSWLREAKIKYAYAAQPLTVAREGSRITVTAKVVGNFPGSPIELDHVFALSGDLIQSLQIG